MPTLLKPRPRESRRPALPQLTWNTGGWRQLKKNRGAKARTWTSADGQWRIDEIRPPRKTAGARCLVFRWRACGACGFWDLAGTRRTLAAAQRQCREAGTRD